MRVGDIVRCIRNGNNPDGHTIDGSQGPMGFGLRGRRYMVVDIIGQSIIYLQGGGRHGTGHRDRFEVVQEAAPVQPEPQPAPRNDNDGEQYTMWIVAWRNVAGGISQTAYGSEEAARSKIQSLGFGGREILLRKKLTFDL